MKGARSQAPKGAIPGYPDLRAAAESSRLALDPEELEAVQVILPVERPGSDVFAARVCGPSMDKGEMPLRDGDWVVLRFSRHSPLAGTLGRIVLVEIPDGSFGARYELKRLRARCRGGLELASDDPGGPTLEFTEPMTIIGCLEQVISPEDIGPTVGCVLSTRAVGNAFGLDRFEPVSGRHGGHLFILVDRSGMLTAPDRLLQVVDVRRPGETAFVLTRRGDGDWRYLGVGRWREDEARWAIPEVDSEAWLAWGTGAVPPR
jgi:hypothetical protein